MARNAPPVQPEADQLPGDAALLLSPQRVVAHEKGEPLSSFTIQPSPASSGVERVVDVFPKSA